LSEAAAASRERRAFVVLAALAAATAAARLATSSGLVEHFDGWSFAQGVERYSLREARPFGFGYPVYVWLGKIVFLWTGDAVRALQLLSIAASTLTLFPIAWLARRWSVDAGADGPAAERSALAAAVFWAASPLSWVVGSEAASDPPGLLVGMLMLVACAKALEEAPGSNRFLLGAAALAGWVLGIRVAYVSLLLPVAYVAFVRLRRERPGALRLALRIAAAFSIPIVVWAGWQLSRDGVDVLVKSRQHLAGHYGNWGMSVNLDRHPWQRPARVLEITTVYGFGSWWPGRSAAAIPATLITVGLVAAGVVRLSRPSAREAARLAVLFGGVYVLSVLVNLDPRFSRYALPLVALLCVIAGIGIPGRAWLARLAVAAIAAALLLTSVPLARLHHDVPRLGYKVARFVGERLDPSRDTLVIANDNEYVDFYISRAAPRVPRVPASEGELHAAVRKLEAEGRRVYSTAPAREDPQAWVPVARLCRGELLDLLAPPEVWIFRHEPGAPIPALPACS
jgi:hypothetical protein